MQELTIGKKYKVTWRDKSPAKTFVGVYLGAGADGRLAFSLRPQAGTSTLPPSWVVACAEVPPARG